MFIVFIRGKLFEIFFYPSICTGYSNRVGFDSSFLLGMNSCPINNQIESDRLTIHNPKMDGWLNIVHLDDIYYTIITNDDKGGKITYSSHRAQPFDLNSWYGWNQKPHKMEFGIIPIKMLCWRRSTKIN